MNGLQNRFYALDLLRFFAAMVVVLYHFTARPGGSFEMLSELTKFGYLGVPIFFMISGFVIAMSANGRTAYQFGVSRFARLYPALWVAIPLTIGVAYFFNGDRFDLWQVVANAALLNDYLGQPDIDGVYWTLHAELKFYACVFLLVAAGLFQRYQVWLTAWLALSAVHLVTGQPFFMGWFISPAWSPFFIIGVATYHIHAFGVGRFNAAILTGALTLAAIRSFMATDGFMVSPSATDSVISALIVLAFAGVLLLIATGKITVRGSQWIVTAGALTYPVYLIHNRAGKAIIDALVPAMPEWAAVLIVVAMVLAVAYIINRWIEEPVSHKIRNFGYSIHGLVAIRSQV